MKQLIALSKCAVAVGVFALLAISANQKTFAAEGDNPRGALLCVWGIQSYLLKIGENCKPDDNEMLGLLRKNVADLEKAIVTNQYATQDRLDAHLNQLIEGAKNAPGDLCDSGGGMDLYLAFRENGVAILTDQAKMVLDVERKPATNPCR